LTDAQDRRATSGVATTKIFVSYRRGDTAGFVHRLYEDLARKYGRAAVFMDLADIEPGEPFPEEIREAAAAAAVFLVVIGARWTSIEDDEGNRRLDEPGDWVVAEVAAALGSGGDVLPVLLEGASLPHADELPVPIQGLLSRQAVEVTPQRWEEDSRRLRKAIDRCLLGRRRRPPLSWGLAAAAVAAALAMLAWLVDLTAVPGLSWGQRLLERGLARRAPAALGDDSVWLVEVDDRQEGLSQRRERYADLLDTVAGAGSSVVALDAVFDWEQGGGESATDRRLAGAIESAAARGSAVILATSGLPVSEETDGRPPRPPSPVPAWLEAAVGPRWGHVCPAITPADGGPFARIEVARLRHDPAGPRGSRAVWPTLALRAVMERLGAPLAGYDFSNREIHLCGPPSEAAGRASEVCGGARTLIRQIPVERFRQPRESAAGNECLGVGADLLMVTLQLLPAGAFAERTRQAADTETLARARQPIVVVGSLREEGQEALGGLRGYQVHAQTIADLLAGRTVRPAGFLATLAMVVVAALVGGLWRRRGRRPLAISEAPTPYRHWLLSAVDAAVATAVVTGLCYLAALLVFGRSSVVLAVPYVAAGCAAAYLLLALAERRRLV
jgi:CHASE2 domain-containing sensor protein